MAAVVAESNNLASATGSPLSTRDCLASMSHVPVESPSVAAEVNRIRQDPAKNTAPRFTCMLRPNNLVSSVPDLCYQHCMTSDEGEHGNSILKGPNANHA